MAAMSSSSGQKLLVKAIYRFKGSNNDELNFKKGDVITVTQREDGGWWEGTLDGKTGWFPSNYAIEISQIEETDAASPKFSVPEDLVAKQIDYRQIVIKDLIEKEKEFVTELQALHKTYLVPLRRQELFQESEYRQLVGNLEEVIEVHRNLHAAIEDASAGIEPREQRLGRVLLNQGAGIRAAHMAYWANHPRAVCILEKYRKVLDDFMEAEGAPSPGLMVLTTALSKPFRHLEKYPAVAQELEQHLEDDHPDRGDTQRSIGFYKNVAADCAKLRRQKELELEVLTGTIRGWEGEDLTTLGDIVHMGSVAVGPEHKDRYFVLFHSNLLILSVSARMSAFIYEGKLPLSGIACNRLEDTDSIKNAFEITGPMIDRIVAMCQTKTDALKWLEVFRHQLKASRQSLNLPPPPPHKVHLSPATQAKRAHNVGTGKGYLWKMSCLRPAPPTRSYLVQDVNNRKSMSIVKSIKKDPDTTYEEDMQILRVIEAYCTSGKQRHTTAASACSVDVCPVSSHQYTMDDENIRLLAETPETELPSTGSCQQSDLLCACVGLRDSVNLSGCLPCKPSSPKGCRCQGSNCTSKWCCGMVADTVKKTAKKF